MRILVLADRDWTHPEAGGSGANLHRQVEQFVALGHDVSVIAAGYPGASRSERLEGVTVHRVGGRTTVFPRAISLASRRLAAEADVVLEVINGITFLTPLWLRRPHVAYVHHVHAGPHYNEELAWLGRPVSAALETIPLRRLYRHTDFVCVSRATQDGLIGLGIPRNQIAVAYNGVEPELFGEPHRSAQPMFLVLGRLKRYKRIELLLDVMTQVPGARLEIAGDGSHREAIADKVHELGLESRVILHGFVDEQAKRELLRSAWAQVTASAAEGWGLTITEAAAAGTTSVGIATGGLREAIIHERTGLLARDADELAAHLRRLTGDRELVERLGANARERVRELTWERTAATTLEALEHAVAKEPDPTPLWRRLLHADVVRAAGLAAAVLANSAIALLCTVVFARWLGADKYGTLASLLSCFLILTVPGSALQVTVARDVSRDPGGAAEALARRALAAVLVLALPVALLLVLVRSQIAAVLGVNLEWAAAATVWFGWLWIALSLERGILQGRRRYRPLALSLIVEAAGRLLFGVALLALGLGATGALLGTGFAIAAAFGVMIAVDPLSRHLGAPPDLWLLARRCGAPLAALSLVAVLQNIDTILVRHRMSSASAGLYSEAAVAARGILWFGVGLGLFLLPEVARMSRRGADARPILAQMIGLVCIVALPLIVAFAVAGPEVMQFVFGDQRNLSSLGAALPLLSVAMTLLAISYLVVQYLLALRRRSFVLPLAVAAIAESVAVLVAEPSFQRVALAIIVVQALLLAVLLSAGLGHPRRRAAVEPGVAEDAVVAEEALVA